MCTVLLPPGVNPIAVNKYINQITKPHVRGIFNLFGSPGRKNLMTSRYNVKHS